MTVLETLTTVRSGSVGSVVHSRNPHGPYTRPRTAPTQPDTARQVTARARLATVSTYWGGTLTPAERLTWAEYAARVSLSNRIGQDLPLTGQQMFIRCNAARPRNLMGVVRTAPTHNSLGTFDSIPMNRFAGIGLIAAPFHVARGWRRENGAYLLCYVGQGQSADTNFYAGPYRLAGWYAGHPLFPPSPGTFNDPWGSPPGGPHTWGRQRLVRADGRATSLQDLPFDAVL